MRGVKRVVGEVSKIIGDESSDWTAQIYPTFLGQRKNDDESSRRFCVETYRQRAFSQFFYGIFVIPSHGLGIIKNEIFQIGAVGNMN